MALKKSTSNGGGMVSGYYCCMYWCWCNNLEIHHGNPENLRKEI
jgi:hypothetical protein